MRNERPINRVKSDNELIAEFPDVTKETLRNRRINSLIESGKIKRHLFLDALKLGLLFLFGLFCAALSMLFENVEDP